MLTKNISRKVEKIVALFTKQLIQKKDVTGVLLLGGLGIRNFLDKYSDLDISIFLDKIPHKHYLPPFSFYINFGKNIVEFNVSQQILSKEFKASWNNEKKDAYSNSKIIYDRVGSMARLLKKKLKRDKKKDFDRLVEIINQYYWRVKVHSISSFYRGYPETSHILINDGINLIVESIYILNKKEAPHHKWCVQQLGRLDYLPKKAVRLLRQTFLVQSYKLNHIKCRIKILDKIARLVMLEIKRQHPHFPSDPYRYWAYRIGNRQLIKRTFADRIRNNLKNCFTKKELIHIHGFISFNLISNVNDLKNTLKRNYSVPFLSQPVRKRLASFLTTK